MARVARAGSVLDKVRRSARATRGVVIALALLALAAATASITAFASSSSDGPRSAPARPEAEASVTGWITTADGNRRLAPVAPDEIVRGAAANTSVVTIDPATRYQQLDGVGGALTESSVWLLSRLPADRRDATLHALFDPSTGAGFAYVRVPLGASDFALSAYSYDDMPPGQTDPTLTEFSIAHDDTLIVPMLQEVLRINPKVKFLASPWSAPAWMKDSGTMYGGGLKREYFGAWTQYLVKAVQAYKARGIVFDTITVQNEPMYSGTDYPTMTLSAPDEATLIGSYVGPAFAESDITTKILAYDHNWDGTAYATSVLSDATAAPYITGTAWHCYSGDVGAQTTVHDAFPTKATYLTECSGRSWSTDYGYHLRWNTQNILGALHDWARTAVLWNLVVDPERGPHTGGCTDCRGVITVDPTTGTVTNNAEYDVLAQVAKVAPPGAVRVESPWNPAGLSTLAFVNPDGSRAVVLANGGASDQAVTVTGAGATFTVTLPAGAVASYRW